MATHMPTLVALGHSTCTGRLRQTVCLSRTRLLTVWQLSERGLYRMLDFAAFNQSMIHHDR